MEISSRVLWVPKDGHTVDHYEDAFWLPEPTQFDSKRRRFAVADGATETPFAGAWAKVLARAYCRGQFAKGKFLSTLPLLEEEWHEEIGDKNLPWYEDSAQGVGARSTIIGLTLHCSRLSREYGWTALAIGDSCLFQIRDDQIAASFPLTHSDQFDNRPVLISTNSETWRDELHHVVHARGTWRPNDTFYLMTDALACWFLYAFENGVKPSGVLDFPADAEAFAQWVRTCRDLGMRNDDVTVLSVTAS